MRIEIGISDFGTRAGEIDGIYIEPVKYYFDRLPDCRKENVAISNKEGEVEIYYVDDEVIKKTGIPRWVRGCNMIGKIHPDIVKHLERRNIDLSVVKKQTVKVVRIKSIIEKYNVTQIDFLKVDTEGHDHIIINDFLDTVNIMPNKIKFENNYVSNKEEIEKLIKRIEALNYRTVKIRHDVVCFKKKD
jgi:FkbM family methyltransferase